MLINFTVDHFRSFGEEQTLNMVATGLKDHPGHCVPIPTTDRSALQIGVIYGANASGKSNLVRAMLFAQELILGQTTLKAFPQHRFRFVANPEPATFEFRFLANEKVFVYGFTITQEAVLEEWLDAASEKGREINVFTRTNQDITIGRLRSFDEEKTPLHKALRALKQLGVRDDQLLLGKIAEMPEDHRGQLLGRVVWWFGECLVVIPAAAQFPSLVEMLDQDADFRRFSAKFLQNVGTGIEDLTVERVRMDADKISRSFLDQLQPTRAHDVAVAVIGPGVTLELDPTDPTAVVRKNLTARHPVENGDYSIAFQDESDGTQRCLNLLPAFYHLTKEPKVFVVDEIDRSLHPLLCHALLKLFLDACPGACQQMIATTHETHLLDLDLLRRDEVWFLEKDRQQQSRLSSLVDWNTRKDLRIDKGYLQGRFGGIPFIGDMQKLMDLIKCPVVGARNAKKTPS